MGRWLRVELTDVGISVFCGDVLCGGRGKASAEGCEPERQIFPRDVQRCAGRGLVGRALEEIAAMSADGEVSDSRPRRCCRCLRCLLAA